MSREISDGKPTSY